MRRTILPAMAVVAAAVLPAKADARTRWQTVRPYNAKLERMAWCESRGRWHIETGNGFSGGLQFDIPTWLSVGGRGRPSWYAPLEQKFRAVRLIHRRGFRPWPRCGSA